MLSISYINSIEFFLDRCDVDLRTGCWNWKLAIGKDGYGRTTGGTLAHKRSFEFFKGPILRPLVHRHTCDNTRCINPLHVVCGTQLENMQDARERGRLFRKHTNA
jgi:hypothetical protein